MKKYIFSLLLISSLGSCRIFQHSKKTGCPVSGAAVGAERILSGDQKAIKAASKSKFKGMKSYR
jgi:hypothetical protein